VNTNLNITHKGRIVIIFYENTASSVLSGIFFSFLLKSLNVFATFIRTAIKKRNDDIISGKLTRSRCEPSRELPGHIHCVQCGIGIIFLRI
jgi:hypothetical protein